MNSKHDNFLVKLLMFFLCVLTFPLGYIIALIAGEIEKKKSTNFYLPPSHTILQMILHIAILM